MQYGQPVNDRPRPRLDSEPRRIPGLEVKALEYQSDPAGDRLDLQPVPPRQRPTATTPVKRKPRLTNQPPYQLHQPLGTKSEPRRLLVFFKFTSADTVACRSLRQRWAERVKLLA